MDERQIMCTNCGGSNPETSKFCQYCGTPLKTAPDPTQQPPYQQPYQPAYAQPAVKKSMQWWQILLVVIGSIFGCFVLIGIIGSIANSAIRGVTSAAYVTSETFNNTASLITDADNGSATATDNSNNTATAAKNKWDDKFEVKDLQMVGSGMTAKVTGSIVNKTDKEFSYVQVEINLYDSTGAQIGSTLTNVTNLEAKGTWKFEAYTLKDNVASIKIKDITATTW